MTCEVFQLLIDELDSGTMNEDLSPHVRRHVSECRSCAEYYKDVQSLSEKIIQLPTPTPRDIRGFAALRPRFFMPTKSQLKILSTSLALAILATFTWMWNSNRPQRIAEFVQLEGKTHEVNFIQLTVTCRKAVQGATLILTAMDDSEFAGRTAATQGKKFLKVKMDLRQGDNTIPIPIRSDKSGVSPFLATVTHPQFHQSTFVEIHYKDAVGG